MEIQDDDIPTLAFVRLANQAGSSDFADEAKELCSPSDGEPL